MTYNNDNELTEAQINVYKTNIDYLSAEKQNNLSVALL